MSNVDDLLPFVPVPVTPDKDKCSSFRLFRFTTPESPSPRYAIALESCVYSHENPFSIKYPKLSILLLLHVVCQTSHRYVSCTRPYHGGECTTLILTLETSRVIPTSFPWLNVTLNHFLNAWLNVTSNHFLNAGIRFLNSNVAWADSEPHSQLPSLNQIDWGHVTVTSPLEGNYTRQSAEPLISKSRSPFEIRTTNNVLPHN